MRFRSKFSFFFCLWMSYYSICWSPITPFFEKAILSLVNLFFTVAKIQMGILLWVYFCVLYSVLLISVSICLTIAHSLHHYSCIIGLDLCRWISCTSFSFSSSFAFPYTFKPILCIYKIPCWILGGIAINLFINLGGIDLFTILFSDPWTGYSSPFI